MFYEEQLQYGGSWNMQDRRQHLEEDRKMRHAFGEAGRKRRGG